MDTDPETGSPHNTADADVDPRRMTLLISGQVQGVGFRAFVRSGAVRLGLAGWATNLADGRVEVVAEGPPAACRGLLAVVRDGWTPGWVTGVVVGWGPPTGECVSFRRQ